MTDPKLIVLDFLNHYMPILTLVGFILLVVIYLHHFHFHLTKKESRILNKISDIALPLGFVASLFATLVSLIYSDYLDQAACGLCWFQRVFIYSQVVLFAIAYVKNDLKIFQYTFWLSMVGGIIALYHEYLQLGYSELIPCPAVASLVDCAKPTFLSFGFITFPFMSITLFLFLILLAIAVRYHRKEK
jgi:disulfide bond formation protein DsbB